MALSLLLMRQIFVMFLMMGCGFAVVKSGLLHTDDSRTLSLLLLYVLTPCMLLNAFRTENTANVQMLFLLSGLGAVIAHTVMFAASFMCRKLLHLSASEAMSLTFTNCGNMLIPLIANTIGQENVIFTTPFFLFQNLLFWSYGVHAVNPSEPLSFKKIAANPNLIAVIAGMLMFLLHLQLPPLVDDAVSYIAATISPVAMILTGMIIAGAELKSLFLDRRVYLILGLKMLVVPFVTMAVLWLVSFPLPVQETKDVLLVVLLCASAPTATMVMQLTRLYGSAEDAAHAGAINIVTTLSCILTIPFVVFVYYLTVYLYQDSFRS